MTDLAIRHGPKAFHCPEHAIEMSLHRYGMEPEYGETYGIWCCPIGGELWFESEGEAEWTEWEE